VGTELEPKNHVMRVKAEPGVCGFTCVIEAHRKSRRLVSIEIIGSECKQILQLAKTLKKIDLTELFAPITQNPVYVSAQRSGCHPSCPIPMAVLKAVEVAMDMALPRVVMITFES